MPEIAFLEALAAHLSAPGRLQPPAGSVGFALPVAGSALPLVALALGSVARVDIGLGGGLTEISRGALRVVSVIDLANPVLPGPGGFPLLNPARLQLILPHGGLIRADALPGALGPADLSLTLDDAPLPPAAFSADPAAGLLTFASPLPLAGLLAATYHLGIWERSTTLLTGELLMGVWDTDPARLAATSAAAIRALLAAAGGVMPGLRRLSLSALGPVGAPAAQGPAFRERPARFAFEFEHVVDRPVSSGGIIRSIPITNRLAAFVTDPGTGALIETVDVESEP